MELGGIILSVLSSPVTLSETRACLCSFVPSRDAGSDCIPRSFVVMPGEPQAPSTSPAPSLHEAHTWTLSKMCSKALGMMPLWEGGSSRPCMVKDFPLPVWP